MPPAATPSRPTQSAEDYLERIHELMEEKQCARVADIASSLNVSQASVTSMVQKLAEQGYLNYQKYRRGPGLSLTKKGLVVARRIRQRHATLSRFFSLLGLDPATQQADIEGIEHHLSPDTVACLADLAEFFEHNPAVLEQFSKSRARVQNP